MFILGPSLLRWYCVYVLIIAVNGMTECFMFATMSKDDVDSYNYKMMAFSAVFLAASWYLTIFGSVGFVIANCLNMLLRIYHRLVSCWLYYVPPIKCISSKVFCEQIFEFWKPELKSWSESSKLYNPDLIIHWSCWTVLYTPQEHSFDCVILLSMLEYSWKELWLVKVTNILKTSVQAISRVCDDSVDNLCPDDHLAW